jgi:predicted acyltransferase
VASIAKRGAVIFLVGLALNLLPGFDPATVRIPGVLQRIALVYAATAALTERTSLRTQVLTAIAALLGYWALLTLVPVPGAGAGALTPEGNLASYIDRALLGRHLLTPTYDPEGLLSTIPAIATALAGVFAGDWLNARRAPHRTLALWMAGFAAMLAGFAWGRVFPINKNLWTSSFALFSAGLAAQTIAICHGLIDTLRWRSWSRPLSAYGRNTLAAYFLSVGLDAVLTRWRVGDSSLKGMVYRDAFAAWLRPCCGAEAASLAYALVYVALWGAVLFELHRRRLFIGI